MAPVGGGVGSIRPGSMVDRARLAKIPLPEAGLKCPRCDSTNTKFCYFNNYSLMQPRHFCKTCRRYWTRGGALRNVPVGGGCRRNKRSKSGGGGNNGSKSGSAGAAAASSEKQQADGGGGSNSTCASPTDITGHFPHLPLMAAAFQNLNHYGGSSSLGGFQPPQLVVGTNGTGGGIGEMGFQLPVLTGFEQPPHTNVYPFHSEGIEASSSVKMEENGQGLNNSTKQFLGTLENNQYWGWTGFSGLNSSSSTTHLL